MCSPLPSNHESDGIGARAERQPKPVVDRWHSPDLDAAVVVRRIGRQFESILKTLPLQILSSPARNDDRRIAQEPHRAQITLVLVQM